MKNRLYYFAPLEGITGYIYRDVYEKYYGGIDKYFSPFVVTRDRGIMKNKEMRDILPENNKNINLIPQILTNVADNFISASIQMKDMGYNEINLNAGCPSGTVVSKGRGAGLLDRTVALDKFLCEIFEKSPCDISIKTRLGVEDTDEFVEILKIYNKYPVRELIIHPRTRKEFYRGIPHREVFKYAVDNSKSPLCYNGDINSFADEEKLFSDFSNQHKIMIGRGFISRPGFTGNATRKNDNKNKQILFCFIDELLERYKEVMSGDIHALHKMKEVCIYLVPNFTNHEKYLKKIKKTNKLLEYNQVVKSLFENEDLIF